MEQISPNLIIKDGLHSYTIKEYIGSGSYGEVWRAIDNDTNKEVAIKFYIMLDEKGRNEFMKEYDIAYGLSHKNLLTASYRGVWHNRPFLVMRYCKNGASTKLVGQLKPNLENEKIIWKFIHDVAAGLSYLHNIQPDPIVHQDIKPDNVLMDSDGGFVITDFGISTKIRSTMSKQSNRAINAGAVAYMGPERFSSQPNPIKASDIWSLGASVFELAMGELPFAGQGGTMLKYGADMPEVDGGWSLDLKNVIYKCLAKDPWDRLKAHELVDYANRILNKSNDPRSTLRKDHPIFDDPPTVYGSPSSKKPEPIVIKKKTGTWIPISLVAMLVLGIIIYSATADKRYARQQIAPYKTLVAKCSNNINQGGAQNTKALFEAKDQLESVGNYENKYKGYFPNEFNKYNGLNNRLNDKLETASEDLAKSAKSQANIGKTDKALSYYGLALKLNPNNKTASKEYEDFVESIAYMKIKDIEFCNYKNNVGDIDDYGSTLYANKMRWLGARILYDGLSNTQKTIDLNVKIIDPKNTLEKYSESPKGYTFVTKNCSVYNNANNTLYLSGWGSESVSIYSKGTYTYEVWYKGKKLFSKQVTLH